MPRVSEYFKLNRTQADLEFIDVDVRGDTRLYIDPRALRSIDSDWGRECVSLLQSFFGSVLAAIQQNDHRRAKLLLASLREPNETHLGMSKGRARGRGMGTDLAAEVYEAFRRSNAVTTGLLSDLEDSILFIDQIGYDRVSDIATNILRGPLIQFTYDAATYYGIPLQDNIASGRIWDRRNERWETRLVSLPMTPTGPLVLVPKAITRLVPSFDADEYYTHYVQPYLQDLELNAPASSLVEILKDNRRRVTKKRIREKYGSGKHTNREITLEHPEILEQYRSAKGGRIQPPDHVAIATATDTPLPDWDALLADVVAVPTGGGSSATAYHHAIERLLTTLLYPALDMPVREAKLHQGRKRIDIDYTNFATSGFFAWVRDSHGAGASFIAVECKNYGSEIANPELDQLSGRFSIHRGEVGILCHRGFGDKDRILERCRDTARDGRGFILPLDDEDLATLVEERRGEYGNLRFSLLHERFRYLVS